MKSLKESILADMDDVIKSGDKNIKESIKQWLKDNLEKGISSIKISKKPNDKGLYEVSAKRDIVYKKSKSVTKLTNDSFVWSIVDGNFECSVCKNLESLYGAPKEVKYSFHCSGCDSLKTLEGAPQEVGHNFYCLGCENLESLKGCPDKLFNFSCSFCNNLKTLEYGPTQLRGDYNCSDCQNLESLYGAPKTMSQGSLFDCIGCTSLKSLEYSPKEVYSYRVNNTGIKTLEGAPEIVHRTFVCSYCKKLESLKGIPKIIEHDFSCTHNNNLKSLEAIEHYPARVGGTYNLSLCAGLINIDLNSFAKKLKQETDVKFISIF